MTLIELEDGWAISTLTDQGDHRGSITISQNRVSKGIVILNANQLAELIRDLKEVYLSITEL